MAIYKGNKKVVAVYKGSTPINKIYKGSTLVFQKSGGGGSTHLFEGTARGNLDLKINSKIIPISPDADGKWFYDTDEKITSLNNAFYRQRAVTSVDLSNLDLTGISTRSMFEQTYVTSIKFNNTKSMKLVDVNSMFSLCSSLTSINLSSFDTSNLTSVNSLFKGCNKLVSLDLSNWNTSSLTTADSLFSGCRLLTSINLSSFNTSNLTSANYLFNNCNSLTSINLSSFDTSNLTSATGLFVYCSSLVSLDLSNFDMSNATSYKDMFANCPKLSTIKCKQTFKDWCITNQDTIKLPTAMREGGSGTWEIVG